MMFSAGDTHQTTERSIRERAFEELFKAHFKSLCNYALFLLKDRDEAEEVVQNMFFNLYNRLDTLDFKSEEKNYLFSAVRNSCLNTIRHGKIKHDFAGRSQGNFNTSSNTEETVLKNELEKKIAQSIQALPEQCGLVFKMSRFGNKKYKEIAQDLNISEKTVENHMGKALKLMRIHLKDFLSLFIILYQTNI